MKIVLDVSAAFAVITGAPASVQILPLLESATQILAPDVFYSEATNAAWKFHHIENLPALEAHAIAERAVQLVDIFFPSDLLWPAALDLACTLGHPAYDCYYLALAKQEQASLLTIDKRLQRLAEKIGISVP